MSEFMLLTGDDYSWDNPALWEAECRCVYEDGRLDDQVHVRRIIAADRGRATTTLRRLMAGFGAVKILLYRLRGPQSPDQIARVADLNRELDRIKRGQG